MANLSLFELFERFHNQIASSAGFSILACSTYSIRTSAIDELTQAAESVVPLLRNQFEVMAYLMNPSLVQLPEALSAVSAAADKTRSFEYSQMLRDRLTSDIKTIAQPGDRSWAIITEPQNYAQTGLIS